MNSKPFHIVLVHGAFVDGSGWRALYEILTHQGYEVTVVQNPTLSLDGDVAATRAALAAQDRPSILVGHSYGGAVITEAGNDPKVAGLVYIAAFAPDKGESVAELTRELPSGAPAPPILPPQDGFLFLDAAGFRAAFAADLSAETTERMARSQLPWGVEALGGSITEPAWRSKPSFYLVAGDDRMIPPPMQRAMAERAGATLVEIPGSHAVYVSQAESVAQFIDMAAREIAVTDLAWFRPMRAPVRRRDPREVLLARLDQLRLAGTDRGRGQ